MVHIPPKAQIIPTHMGNTHVQQLIAPVQNLR